MRTIYIDSEFHCHLTDDGTMRAVETTEFDGKCDTWIKGYCYDDSKGYVAIYPWREVSQLEAAQTQYETMNAQLNNTYQEGVNSA